MPTPVQPTPEQHAALLSDMRFIGAEMPKLGAVKRGEKKPYYPTRYLPKVEACADDPDGLVGYAKKLVHSPVTDGCTAIAWFDRLDLAVETLVADETKVYAPLFGDADRIAARERLEWQTAQVDELGREHERLQREGDDRVIARMDEQRRLGGKASLSPEQKEKVRESRRRPRDVG